MSEHIELASVASTPGLISQLLDNGVTLLFARICITLPFLVSGLLKIFDRELGEAEMVHVGLQPAWLYNAATLITQLVGSALIISNRLVWLGAGALGVFTVLTDFLAHRFWELDGAAKLGQLNTFLEHGTISAAFILVTVVGLRTAHQTKA